MVKEYPYLVAGLPELSLEFSSSEQIVGIKNFDYERIMNEVSEHLGKDDVKYLRLLSLGLDNPVPFFYRMAAKSNNRFIREYFLLDVNLRNIQTGIIARKTGKTLDTYLVGDDMLTQAIRTSKANDFGLAFEMEDIQRIIAILEIPDILEREQKLDLFRWEKINEITLFHYLDTDIVLAFVVKAFLVSRWLQLDKERGNAMFKQLLEDCRGASEYTKMPE